MDGGFRCPIGGSELEIPGSKTQIPSVGQDGPVRWIRLGSPQALLRVDPFDKLRVDRTEHNWTLSKIILVNANFFVARKRLEWLGISFWAADFSGGVEARVFSWGFGSLPIVVRAAGRARGRLR